MPPSRRSSADAVGPSRRASLEEVDRRPHFGMDGPSPVRWPSVEVHRRAPLEADTASPCRRPPLEADAGGRSRRPPCEADAASPCRRRLPLGLAVADSCRRSPPEEAEVLEVLAWEN